jgi:mono/diheme cytochrome c family protein
LFRAACAVCHESPNRSDTIPALSAFDASRQTAAQLKRWIAVGRSDSLMPPFARSEGGILSETQIESVVEFVRRRQSPGGIPPRRLPLQADPGIADRP